MDIIGAAGVVVALIALWVAVYGVRDVRKLVRELVTTERNRAYTQILHLLVWEFVGRTGKALSADNGYGTWKPDMDPDRARVRLEKWQADKNAARVAKMLASRSHRCFDKS